MNDSSEFLAQVSELKKWSRRSVPFVALGLLLIVAALAYSIIQLRDVNKEIEEANGKKELAVKAVLIEEHRLSLLRSEIALLSQNLSIAQQQSGNEQASLEAVKKAAVRAEELRKSVDDAQASLIAAVPEQIPPRVYFHIAREQQRAGAKEISKSLMDSADVTVPGIELVSRAPSTTELRYFKRSEKALADRIGAELRKDGLALEVEYIDGYENSTRIRPNHFELWMSAAEQPPPSR